MTDFPNECEHGQPPEDCRECRMCIRGCGRRVGNRDLDVCFRCYALANAFGGALLGRQQLGNLPQPEAVIDRLAWKPAAGVMVGQWGSGKSFVTLSMSLSIATGISFVGHEVMQAPVMFVVGEGASGLDKRIRAWEEAWNKGKPVPSDDFITFPAEHSIHNPDFWTEMKHAAHALSVGLVVFDTFSSLAPDADETHDAASILHGLKEVAKKANCSTLLVHHTGHGDQSRARGGSQIESNADYVLLLSGGSNSEHIELKVKKHKDGPDGYKVNLRRRPFAESCIVEVANPNDITIPLQDRITHLLEMFGEQGATQAKLLEEMPGVVASTMSSAVNSMAKQGLVVKEVKQRGALIWLPEYAPEGMR